ncbi:MAG: ribonuclease III [Spirochaetes bacterium]|nr:ribonuclease III [Spirochaetota bacterium]
MDRPRRELLTVFQKKLGARFKSVELLNLALTHRSLSSESNQPPNNEKLEFLGDAVLGVIVASLLFSSLGDKAEGDLARIKSFVVSEDTLSELSLALGVDAVLNMGKGEEMSGGRGKRAILADAMEAIIGALYVDQGIRKAESFVRRLVMPEIDKVLANRHRKDYKTILQDFAQKYYRTYPAYAIVGREGPDHDRTFHITCRIAGKEYGPASGHSKKEAEREAAGMAYESILRGGGADADRLVQLR